MQTLLFWLLCLLVSHSPPSSADDLAVQLRPRFCDRFYKTSWTSPWPPTSGPPPLSPPAPPAAPRDALPTPLPRQRHTLSLPARLSRVQLGMNRARVDSLG